MRERALIIQLDVGDLHRFQSENKSMEYFCSNRKRKEETLRGESPLLKDLGTRDEECVHGEPSFLHVCSPLCSLRFVHQPSRGSSRRYALLHVLPRYSPLLRRVRRTARARDVLVPRNLLLLSKFCHGDKISLAR